MASDAQAEIKKLQEMAAAARADAARLAKVWRMGREASRRMASKHPTLYGYGDPAAQCAVAVAEAVRLFARTPPATLPPVGHYRVQTV